MSKHAKSLTPSVAPARRRPTLAEAIETYLAAIAGRKTRKTAADGRSANNTHIAYSQACKRFAEVLAVHNVHPARTPVEAAETRAKDWLVWFIKSLKDYAPSTEGLFITAVMGFFEHLIAEEDMTGINIVQLRLIVKRRERRKPPTLRRFPKGVEKLLTFANSLPARAKSNSDERATLRALRERAFIFTLADTGLRISEACALTRGQIDWDTGKAILVIKGGREETARFSRRALNALRAYLDARATLDGASSRPLASLPLFARHDDGAGRKPAKIKPLSHVGARKAFTATVVAALGKEAHGTITPHTLRHFFVTRIVQTTKNLKLAQELARHRQPATTAAYAHLADDELDAQYREVFD